MNTELVKIFTDATSEYLGLQNGVIDFTDTPCTGTPTTGTCGILNSSPNFLTTAPVPETAYFELEFHLANMFWNCNFDFGNSACGVQIRQAISHMFDKTSFCANSAIAGTCTALDVLVPSSSGGGLPTPNPCAYDASNQQSGTNCVVGAPGGTAYHLGAATGANGDLWLYAPGSADLNAAAQHLVNAGVATGFSTTTSVMTGAVTTGTEPTFFIRTDDTARNQLGQSIASQICYLFTGVYSAPCNPYLNMVMGPITVFQGYTTCITICQNWWFYTAGFSNVQFFDNSLYFTYNSRFVSGFPGIQPPSGPCSAQSLPTNGAGDYMYLCSPTYDSLSSQMENAPCLTSPLDPAKGQPNNGPGGDCTIDPTKLSATSTGIQAEAYFGANAFTIPVYQRTVQFGFANNGWIRDINGAGVGLPNYFTWLDAYNPTPPVAGTIRQGFSSTTRSLNPFVSSVPHDVGIPQDLYILGNIYDSLSRLNPVNLSQRINWMTYSIVEESNATVHAQSGYEPPSGTATTYHFILRNDLFFQDGRPVTAYDVAFSYLAAVGSGSYLGTGANSITGITIISPRIFDIGVSSLGVFVLPNLTGVFIVPGRYWSGVGSSAWDTAVAACNTGTTSCSTAQYSLSNSTVTCPTGLHPGCSSFPASNMQIDPAKITASYDPLANQTLVGSGPWKCGIVTGTGSGSCSSSGTQNPPSPGGSFSLTRFGAGLSPASSTSAIYFRSSGDLALYLWAQENDISPISPLSAVAVCFGQPVNPSGSCSHWQRGIGASPTGVVGINQVSIVELRYNLNWLSPFEWATSPPQGIGVNPPTLYEGPVTLNTCSVDPMNGYDC